MTDYEGVTLDDGIVVLYCTDCGALVWDQTAHDGWHQDMARLFARVVEIGG